MAGRTYSNKGNKKGNMTRAPKTRGVNPPHMVKHSMGSLTGITTAKDHSELMKMDAELDREWEKAVPSSYRGKGHGRRVVHPKTGKINKWRAPKTRGVNPPHMVKHSMGSLTGITTAKDHSELMKMDAELDREWEKAVPSSYRGKGHGRRVVHPKKPRK